MVRTSPEGYEKEVVKGRAANMCDFYETSWLPFGKLLTDMEQAGFTVDVGYLKQIEGKCARADRQFWPTRMCSGMHSGL